MKKYLFGILFIIPFYLSANQYSIKKIGIEQGLSNDYIQGITQDRQGFIWFSTRSGLNRFDGHKFKIYKRSDYETNTINSNELNLVYADKFDNIVWIATERTGLIAFNYTNNQFSFYGRDYNETKALSADGVTGLTNDASGNLWIATYMGGVDLMNKKTKRFTHYNQSNVKGLVSNYNWCVADDHVGNLYIGHISEGLSIVSLKTRTAISFKNDPNNPNSIPGNIVTCILIDSRKQIWVGTENGLALFDPILRKFTVFRKKPGNPNSLSDNNISAITETRDNKLWIGTIGGGINILEVRQNMFNDPANVLFQHIAAMDNPNGLSNPNIKGIMQDSFNNIWVGTMGGGVNFISSKPDFFRTLSYSPTRGNKNSLSNKIVCGLSIDQYGLLWAGTEGGGIDVFNVDAKVRNYSEENRSIPDNKVLSTFRDSKNNLWFGSFDGTVLCYNSTQKRFNPIKNLNTSGVRIRCFYEDSNQNLWIGTDIGVCVYNISSGAIKIFDRQNSKLPDHVVRSISGDQKGRIWVGTLGGGLVIFTQQFNLVRLFGTDKGFYGIEHILKDYKNRM